MWWLRGVVALCLLAWAGGSAQAQAYNWSGFYIGANAGYGSADISGTAPGGTYQVFGLCNIFICGPQFAVFDNPVDITARGAVIGGHVGFNHIVHSRWLVGIEADGSWLNSRGSTVLLSGTDNFFADAKVTWQASLRGRLGVTEGPWLLYATGGISFVRASIAGGAANTGVVDTCGDDCFANVSTTVGFGGGRTLIGWIAGIGAERMLTPTWIVRGEVLISDYGRADFGTATVTTIVAGGGTTTNTGPVTAGLHMATFRIGLSAKFP
jgi:opacity protein-like surface antigen